MLFDLQGKRRRLIQATYLTLAILMGGGLVLFGIGSDVQGGLADFFSGSGGGNGSPVVEEQLEEAEERLVANPEDPDALADVARANYQLATTTDEEARAVGALFAEDAAPQLEAAADAWNRYLETQPERPDEALAFLMVQVYGEQGLNQPAEAAEAAEVVASERRDPQAYLVLTQYAALAGDDRKAELAGRRAVTLAPDAQQDQVERQVTQLIRAAEALREQNQPAGPGDTGAAPPGGLPLPGEDGAVVPEEGPGQGGGSGSGAP